MNNFESLLHVRVPAAAYQNKIFFYSILFLMSSCCVFLWCCSTSTVVTWSSCWAAMCTCRGASASAWLWTSLEGWSTCTAKASSTGTSPPRWQETPHSLSVVFIRRVLYATSTNEHSQGEHTGRREYISLNLEIWFYSHATFTKAPFCNCFCASRWIHSNQQLNFVL